MNDQRRVKLTEGRDPKLLATVVDRINDLQKKTGELKELRPLKHGQHEYVERVKIRDGKPAESEYYFVRNNLLVFSTREAPLKQVLIREVTGTNKAVAPSLWLRIDKDLGLNKSLVSLLLNPPAFDQVIVAQADRAGRGGPA